MFRLVKRIFVSAIMLFNYNLSIVNSLECFSISNQECKVRQEIVHVNSKEPIFYPFSIRILMIPTQNYAFLTWLKI